MSAIMCWSMCVCVHDSAQGKAEHGRMRDSIQGRVRHECIARQPARALVLLQQEPMHVCRRRCSGLGSRAKWRMCMPSLCQCSPAAVHLALTAR